MEYAQIDAHNSVTETGCTKEDIVDLSIQNKVMNQTMILTKKVAQQAVFQYPLIVKVQKTPRNILHFIDFNKNFKKLKRKLSVFILNFNVQKSLMIVSALLN